MKGEQRKWDFWEIWEFLLTIKLKRSRVNGRSTHISTIKSFLALCPIKNMKNQDTEVNSSTSEKSDIEASLTAQPERGLINRTEQQPRPKNQQKTQLAYKQDRWER